MQRFASLLSTSLIAHDATQEDWKRPGREQRQAEAAFPSLLQTHGFRVAEPGAAPPANVHHFVLGIATWSVRELILMDALSLALKSTPERLERLSVFSIGRLTLAQLQRFIPGIEPVTTPVLGLWLSGALSALEGFNARHRIIHEFHLHPHLDELATRDAGFWKRVEALQTAGKTGFVRRD
jgi:hypothetical protein